MSPSLRTSNLFGEETHPLAPLATSTSRREREAGREARKTEQWPDLAAVCDAGTALVQPQAFQEPADPIRTPSSRRCLGAGGVAKNTAGAGGEV